MRSFRSSLGALSALAVGAFVATATLPAAADGILVSESIEVRYGDLDLDTAAGIAELYARLKNAAERVCGTGYKPQVLFLAHSWRTCVKAALEQGIAAVDRPALTAYHATQSGPRVAPGLSARN
jgi:UrcA family protein